MSLLALLGMYLHTQGLAGPQGSAPTIFFFYLFLSSFFAVFSFFVNIFALYKIFSFLQYLFSSIYF